MHDNDADVMIVEQALDLLKNNNVCVIADDTDVFVLLLSKVSKLALYGIYLKQPKAERLLNISSIVGLIQEEKLKQILLLHAMSGCDTTSFLFGVGKTKLYKKEILEKHEDLSGVFYNSDSIINEIISAGEKIIMELYTEAKKCGDLNSLRSFLFKKQLQKRGLIQKKVDIRRLPPSSSAAGYHSLRVYHQIQEWLGNNLDPLQYGWKISEDRITPVTTDLPLAPENLLHRIKCACRTNCKSGNCSCKRVTLYCSQACGCNTDECTNTQQTIIEEDIEDVLDGDEDEVL